MSLREHAPGGSDQGDASVIFEERSYGFTSPVIRENLFVGTHQVQKRICYCTDSRDCKPAQVLDIGQLTITGEQPYGLSVRYLARSAGGRPSLCRSVAAHVAPMRKLWLSQMYGMPPSASQ